MNGSLVVCVYYGILLSNKNEQSTDTHNDLDESPEDKAEWIRPILKGYIICDFFYITFLK